jgi:hypothetical protein
MNDRCRASENDLQSEKEVGVRVQNDIAILREHWAELGYGPEHNNTNDLRPRVERIEKHMHTSDREDKPRTPTKMSVLLLQLTERPREWIAPTRLR